MDAESVMSWVFAGVIVLVVVYASYAVTSLLVGSPEGSSIE